MNFFKIIMFIFFIWTIDLQSSNDNTQVSTRLIQSNQRPNPPSANNTFARPPLQQSAENDNVVNFVRKLVIHGYQDEQFILAMGPRAEGQPNEDRRTQDIYGTTQDWLMERVKNEEFYNPEQAKDNKLKLRALFAFKTLQSRPALQQLSLQEKRFLITVHILPSIHQAVIQSFPEDTQTNSQNQ